MPLLIEDGTGVEDANSYITVDELRTFALDRGVAFPAAPSSGTDPAIATYTPFLIRACDYLESRRDEFSGMAMAPDTQTLIFPRIGIYTNPTFNGMFGGGWLGMVAKQLPPVPTQIKNAQAQLVLEQLNGISIMPSQPALGVGTIPDGPDGAIAAVSGQVIIRDKVDVLETQWSDTQGRNIVPLMPAVEGFLKPLLMDGGRFFSGQRI